MFIRKFTGAVMLLAIAANVATAQESNGVFTVGVGGAFTAGPYIGDDTSNDTTAEGKIIPLLSYETDRFSISVLEGASYTVYRDGAFDVTVLATPRYSDLDGTDIVALQGIDRKTTLDAGFGLDYAVGQTILSASVLGEVTGEHGGFEVGAKVTRFSQFDDLVIAYAAGAVWQSEELTNYQFGVLPSEALADRPAYTTDAAITPFIEVGAEYAVSDSWSVVAAGQYTYLTDALADSPIVGSRTSLTVLSGVVYKF